MARLLRIRYPGAIYHIVMNVAARRRLFKDRLHYEQFTEGLRAEVARRGWRVFAFCWLPHQCQLLLQTPEPNLSQGMQYWLSSYTNWYSYRNGVQGDLFRGRYKSYVIEDASYYWPLSRWIHLGPCMGKAPPARRPEDWPHSSYAGYCRKSAQLDWIDYRGHHQHWLQADRGREPAPAYRAFVKQGLENPPENPLAQAWRGFIVGSQAFAKKLSKLVAEGDAAPQRRLANHSARNACERIIKAVAKHHRVNPREYQGAGNHVAGRDLAAFLCRKWTPVTLSGLSEQLGLGSLDGSASLVRRAAQRINHSASARRTMEEIEKQLGLNS